MTKYPSTKAGSSSLGTWGIRHSVATIRRWLQSRFTPPTFGEQGERAAARFLRKLGYQIVTTRHRLRYGEIDVIALDGQTVVFVEVKTRRTDRPGEGAEAVNAERQARLTRAALAFLKGHGLLEYASRFDVVEVLWPEGRKCPEIRHLVDAFPAVGKGQMYS